MILLAKWIVIAFGLFIVFTGLLMLINPEKARSAIGKAGSTNFINYAEITIRTIPAIGLIVFADFSRFPDASNLLGWFMLVTSLVLYVIPRKLHHAYAVKSAQILKPLYIRLLSPVSFIFGFSLIYSAF